MEANLLTYQDAVDFIENKLHIHGFRKRFSDRTTRKPLLDEIVFTILRWIPFTTVYLLADPTERRKACSVPQTVERLLDGTGGLCFTNNCSALLLLRALGFEAELHLAIVHGEPSHALITVRNLQSPGDRFLVDVGFGNPTFSAVSLNFQTESDEYHESTITYKFLKSGDNIIRLHGKRAGAEQGFVQELQPGWVLACEFNMTEATTPEVARATISALVHEKQESFFQELFELCRWNEKGRRILLKNTRLILEEEDGSLTKLDLGKNAVVLEETALTYFANQKKDVVAKALSNWIQATTS